VDYGGLVSMPKPTPSITGPLGSISGPLSFLFPNQFLGWYDGPDKWQFDQDPVTQDTTLDANYLLFGISFDNWVFGLVMAGDHLAAVVESPYPNINLRITLWSSPTRIGTLHTDADGNGRALITLPNGFPAGSHTIVLMDDSGHAVLSIPVTAKVLTAAKGRHGVLLTRDKSRPVTLGNSANSEGTTKTTTTSQGATLADTGTSVVGTTAFGLVLLALGCVLELAGRRRRLS
jgi:hypothetical protein